MRILRYLLTFKNRPAALAFDKRVTLTNDPVVVRVTAVSALPKNQQIFGDPDG